MAGVYVGWYPIVEVIRGVNHYTMNSHLTTKIAILSDQVLFNEGLKGILEKEPDSYEISTYSTKFIRIKSTLKSIDPHIVLMDANGSRKEVWTFLKNVCALLPETKVVILANTNEYVYRQNAEKNGAVGYVLKSSPKELLIGAMKVILGGGKYYDPGATGDWNINFSSKLKNNYGLSGREMDVVHLIKEGYSTKDIASHLNLSFHTIETHRKNIYNKLQIRKVTELLNLYAEISM